MNGDKPSWHTSTLSQLTLGVSVFYATFALLVAAGVIFFKLPIETAKEVMAWPTLLWTNVTTAYFTSRRGNGANAGGTHGVEPVKPQG